MKKAKKGFISWYYNLVDKRKDCIIEMTIASHFEDELEECYLLIESNKKELCKEISLTPNQLKWEKQKVLYGESSFEIDRLQIDIHEEGHIKADLIFGEQKGTYRSKWQAGIMGPFRYIPFLQSYHDVLSLSHELKGTVTIDGKSIDFSEGRGYVEKEWGKEHPRVWVWAQCNHFKEQDIAVMIGVARIPFLWEYYTSFAVPLYYKGQLEVFSNYNGGQIAKLYRYKGYIHLVITQKSKVLDIKIYGEDDIEHVTVHNTHAIRDVYACQGAKMEIKMVQSNHVIFEDRGYCCQLEMGGNTSKLK